MTRWKPNTTVAAIIEQQGRFLLVQERTPEGLRLNNPAGHLDPGESLVQACARETLEETSYIFEPQALLGVYLSRVMRVPSGDAGQQEVTYLRFAFRGALGALQSDRSLDCGIVRTLWLTVEELRASQDQHRSPLVLRCVEDYLSGQHWPLDMLHTEPSVFGAGHEFGVHS